MSFMVIDVVKRETGNVKGFPKSQPRFYVSTFLISLFFILNFSFYCGQLFLNFDSFSFTSLALSVNCIRMGLSLL